MPPTLLHIGAGPLDLWTLRRARSSGLHVVATDPDPDAPGARECRCFHVLDEGDVEGHRELALELKRAASSAAADGDFLGAHSFRPSAAAALRAVDEVFGSAAPPPGTPDVEPSPPARGVLLEVNAYLRDGDYVPAGVAERRPVGDEEGVGELVLLCAAPRPDELSIHALVEEAARGAGLARGPLGAWLELEGGEPRLQGLAPRFTHPATVGPVSELALGRSAALAWFASMAQTGGPFDALPLVPKDEERPWAGWIALPREPGQSPLRAVEGALDEKTVHLWTSGLDAADVERRLHSALGRRGSSGSSRSVA